ncbi:TRAP transporter permease [Jiangella asiatica]|uniref:TRAP transporter fused permease subunit n=1 Tax=Jiangella asiatica TaxID=2530372 RepID=A0A4R5DGU4_9ACTN|nr:TRAP transporter fused permease subunit [Jiangella asiatica]TDE09663.1 TRAP transporter fused permease subunit [Jiangella asiatica]
MTDASTPRHTAGEPAARPVADPVADVSELMARYDEELPARRLSGRVALTVGILCFGVALFVLRQVFSPLSEGNQYYLMLFLAFVLPLVFLCYRPVTRLVRPDDDGARPAAVDPRLNAEGDIRRADNPGPLDWALAVLALVACLYPLLPVALGESGGGFDAFLDRQGSLTGVDVVMGSIVLVLVIEATRRTTGWILPGVCVAFVLYAYYGGFLPTDLPGSHAGIDFDQIINALYNDPTGFYGVPLDVCATYIVLFTIYGAVLDRTGAGQFFIDLSFSLFRRSRTAPGRTVALSGFLLGTVSGSGTATAVGLGAVTWPVLKRAGYPRENAGGMLAASGIGAILSPPTLGAAAFIIAEYLGTSYLNVLVWALVPTLLYYLGIFLAIEIDARKSGVRAVDLERKDPWRLLARSGYHFLSLGIIVVFLAVGMTPFRAVVYATVVALGFGVLDAVISSRGRDVAGVAVHTARVVYDSLSGGVRSVLPVAAVCAAAGIIVSTITKTGLGQVLSDMLVDAASALTDNASAVLILSAVFAAIAILILGLAVPVTASFIISWVIIGPALLDLGVAAPAVAMFIFYYSVLSEVSPPTALAAVASSAITGGRVIATMWQACKYALPAFLVPMAFVLTDEGSALLLERPAGDVVWTVAVSAVAVAALAATAGGWLVRRAGPPERALCAVAAALLLYLNPVSITLGAGVLALAVVVHLALARSQAVPPRTREETPT